MGPSDGSGEEGAEGVNGGAEGVNSRETRDEGSFEGARECAGRGGDGDDEK